MPFPERLTLAAINPVLDFFLMKLRIDMSLASSF
jgi:hypothetical protein